MGVPELAEHLGVGERTVYAFLDRGLIPADKLGRVIRLKRADVDAFLEANRVEPGSLRHLYPPAAEDEDSGENA